MHPNELTDDFMEKFKVSNPETYEQFEALALSIKFNATTGEVISSTWYLQARDDDVEL